MTDEQLKTIWSLYTDLWKLFKDYHDSKTDEQWEQCTEQAAKLVEKYGEHTRPLVIDTLELIERSSKCKRT